MIKKILQLILIIPTILFYIITKFRNFLYDHNILKSQKLSVPVISVGNLTIGGTGKTPFTISLATFLNNEGYKVGIITRGYQRKSKGQLIVSNGNGPLDTAKYCGDEPYLMARKTKNITIIADKNRTAAGKTAINKFHCNILICDDGFQHRKLKKDINIILWDSSRHPANTKIFPAGRLRESISGIKRANFVFFSRTEKLPKSQVNFLKRINPDLSFSYTSLKNEKLIRLVDDKVFELNTIRESKILAFCGLGNRKQFYSTINSLTNYEKNLTINFPDHHKYSCNDLDKILKLSEKNNCNHIITTEKDAVNFPQNSILPKNLMLLTIFMDIKEDDLFNILQSVKNLKQS